MTKTLTEQDSFLIWGISLVIGVASFWLTASDLCLGDFEIPSRLIVENGEIDQVFPKQVLQQEACCSWRGVVSRGHYSRS